MRASASRRRLGIVPSIPGTMQQTTGSLAQAFSTGRAESLAEGCVFYLVAVVMLYLIVRDGVTRGMLTAWKKRDEQRLREAVKAEQAAQAAAAARRASPGPTPPGASRSGSRPSS